jgi:pimeloyl-ACP methyl ester carboxylesterase
MTRLETLAGGDRAHPVDLLILPGMPQAPSDLRGLAEPLSAIRRTHIAHFPGYGDSREHHALAPELDRVESDLADALRVLGVQEYDVLGFSGGSYRCFRAAVRGTLRPRRIVALGPLPFVPEPMGAGWRQAVALSQSGVDVLPGGVDAMFSAPFRARSPGVVAGCLGALREQLAMEALHHELLAVANDVLTLDQLAALTCPVYLRVGELDANTPPALSTQAATVLSHARVDIVPGVAHMLHHEDLPATLDAVTLALEGHPW